MVTFVVTIAMIVAAAAAVVTAESLSAAAPGSATPIVHVCTLLTNMNE
jgi:hypothetical protein